MWYSDAVKMDLATLQKQFPAAAEYLSSIYILLRDYGYVSHTRLAEWNNVSAPAVSQAIGRLKRLGLVRQKRYENVMLTDDGRDLAVTILRRHYLVEHLLVGILGYPWDKADEEAKLLQTQISDDLSEHLYHRLGSPKACPHGNPMPSSPIEQKLLNAPKLSQAPTGERVRILRITEEGEQLPSMLAFCFQNGIRPGAKFRVNRDNEAMVRLEPVASSGSPSPSDKLQAGPVDVAVERAEHIRYETMHKSRSKR